MKYALTIIFSLFCTYAFSIETPDIKVSYSYPRNIKSNGKESFILSIYNNEDTALYDLELSTFNDNNLEITLDKLKIGKIEPKETIKINMEIINSNKYYFSKKVFITVKISNEEFSKDDQYSFTIKPVDNFWRLIIISVALLSSVSFTVIFIKTNKGEENAR
jgi:uncharacterized membrane protein